MKPVIFYIDDEPHNLTVFENSLPEEWEIVTFQNPLVALEALEKQAPWVIVTDQTVEIRYVIPTQPDGPHLPFCLLRTDYRPPAAGTERNLCRSPMAIEYSYRV